MSISFDGDWLVDESKSGEVVLLRVTRRLQSAQTPFQRAEIVQTEAFGRALVLDGALQSCSKDEFIYHESLVHPAMLAHPDPRRVAILGGGEGATLREVLRHKTVEVVTMIDIDPEVVAFCRQQLPTLHGGAFDDPRSRLVYADARAWIADQPGESLDLVIVDISEPVAGGPACQMFTREFYRLVERALTADGVMVAQAGAANQGEVFFFRVFRSIGEVFDRCHPLVSFLDSYSDLWGFGLACRGQARLPEADRVDALVGERLDGRLRYYDGLTHRHMTSLPRYLRSALAGTWDPYTDGNPPGIRYEHH